ncbi:MAG: cobyrinate a,c-diamide synthase [Lachnospiraceae bacterium]|nr:cobyrinate a,c-diamide synthase [Lachnospiraceae bacterium]
MNYPRIMLTAAASGSGKTLITCGLLAAFQKMGLTLTSFKVGPDYIDPMFHRTVLGIPSRNLDSFLADPADLPVIIGRQAKGADLSVIEGVMGYYDGAGFNTTQASSYEVSVLTRTPVIVVLNARGMALTAAALLKGMQALRPEAPIKGVILNQVSAMAYPGMKEAVEKETGLKVLGYVPKLESGHLESRHLGLVTPQELKDIKAQLEAVGDTIAKTVDLEGILALAREAGDIPETDNCPRMSSQIHSENESSADGTSISENGSSEAPLRIGVARDEAFCFYYEDNFDLLKEMGAELVPFSPMRDETLPDVDGLYFGGGYPELYTEILSRNVTMRESVKAAVEGGLPTIAECGGFLYLHREIEDVDRKPFPMAGVIDASAAYTGRLQRFGYVTLELQKEQLYGKPGERARGHEFHYYDSEQNGEDAKALKLSGRSWACMNGTDTLEAGFPHLYFRSNPNFIRRFLDKCREGKR